MIINPPQYSLSKAFNEGGIIHVVFDVNANKFEIQAEN